MKIYARELRRILDSLPDRPSRDDRFPHTRVYAIPQEVRYSATEVPPSVDVGNLTVKFDGNDWLIES